MNQSRTVFTVLAVLGAVGLLASGCDPKLTDSGGDSGGSGGSEPSLVSSEARTVGAILAVHMEILTAAMGHSAEYDTTLGTLLPRSLFTSDCMEIALVDSEGPVYSVRLDGCIDGNGTEYRGGGAISPFEGLDGYYFFPYGNAEDMLIADNPDDQNFNNVYDAGNLKLTFRRGGDGFVEGVTVSSFMRHGYGSAMITLSYVDVEYAGAHGSIAQFPKAGQIINGTWDGVDGSFEIEFSGGSSATYTLAASTYTVNLNDGSVDFAT